MYVLNLGLAPMKRKLLAPVYQSLPDVVSPPCPRRSRMFVSSGIEAHDSGLHAMLTRCDIRFYSILTFHQHGRRRAPKEWVFCKYIIGV